MEYTNKDIIIILRGFKEAERRKKQILFEIEHESKFISGEDIIDAMSFKSGMLKLNSGSRTAEIIPDIALSYADKAESLNERHYKELLTELYKITMDTDRLSYYVSLLPTAQTAVITRHYLEGQTVSQTATQMNTSETSVKYMLRAAIKELAQMYNYIQPRSP